MIPRKKKICIDCGQEKYLYAHGRCGWCDSIHRAKTKLREEGRSVTVEPPKDRKRPNIPLRTKKRLKQEQEYSVVKQLLIDEAKSRDEFRCFFCGRKFRSNYTPDAHHLEGREEGYHDQSVHNLPWFEDYVARLKKTHLLLAYKELLKLDK